MGSTTSRPRCIPPTRRRYAPLERLGFPCRERVCCANWGSGAAQYHDMIQFSLFFDRIGRRDPSRDDGTVPSPDDQAVPPASLSGCPSNTVSSTTVLVVRAHAGIDLIW